MKEYIEKEKLIKRLHNAEENYKADHDYDIDNDPFSDGILSAMFSVNQIVGSEPTANVVEIPERVTNGDMIKSMFPNARVSQIFPSFNGDEVYYVTIEKVNGVTNEMRVMKSWWNAPYKKEV